MPRYSSTPSEALIRQINVMQEAIDRLQAAVDEITGSINPATATWADVTKFSHLVDGVKRGDLVSDEQ